MPYDEKRSDIYTRNRGYSANLESITAILDDFKITFEGVIQEENIGGIYYLLIIMINADLLDQEHFDLVMKHTMPNKLYLAMNELQKANCRSSNNFKILIVIDPIRLKVLALQFKEKNLFSTLEQRDFDKFIEEQNSSFTASQLLSRFTAPYYLYQHKKLETCEDLRNYENYFIWLGELLKDHEPMSIYNGLNELIAPNASGDKKIELLLIVGNYFDQELMNVVRMRQKISSDKKNGLIVMPYDAYKSVMQIQELPGITKLSFLHHSGEEAVFLKPNCIDYDKRIAEFKKKMPQLKAIVSRGCKTVDLDSYKPLPEDKIGLETYSLKMLKPHNDITIIQVKQGKVLVLQKIEEEGLTTYLKYTPSSQNKPIITRSTKILKRDGVKELTSDELNEISFCCNGITLVTDDDFLTHKALVTEFFNPNPMKENEVKKVKRSELRARTLLRKDFGDASSIVNTMREKLLRAECYHVSVKGYIGGYKCYYNRVIPVYSHDYSKYPKAVRVEILPPEEFKQPELSFPLSQPSFEESPANSDQEGQQKAIPPQVDTDNYLTILSTPTSSGLPAESRNLEASSAPSDKSQDPEKDQRHYQGHYQDVLKNGNQNSSCSHFLLDLLTHLATLPVFLIIVGLIGLALGIFGLARTGGALLLAQISTGVGAGFTAAGLGLGGYRFFNSSKEHKEDPESLSTLLPGQV